MRGHKLSLRLGLGVSGGMALLWPKTEGQDMSLDTMVQKEALGLSHSTANPVCSTHDQMDQLALEIFLCIK